MFIIAGGKGSTHKNDTLTWALTTAAAPTRPTSWQVALYTDATGLSAGGAGPVTEATTTTFPGYARQTCSFGASAATGGTISNTTDTAFTATGAGTTAINYWAIIDNLGVMRYWAPMTTSRTPQANGDKVDFAIGSLVCNES